jgi:GNAT superfamily N-acetyltransferase
MQAQRQSRPGRCFILPTTQLRCTRTRSIRIRPIRPDDGRKLQRLHGRLSDSTIYQRFHGPKPELDEVWARRFAALNGHAAAAFVATTGTRGRIVGVARYYKIDATTTAEVAFVVEDAYQGCGIGMRLMKRLREQALRNGITEFVALLLPRNERMLRLLRAVGPTQIRAESGTVAVQVDISQAEAALAPTSTWCEAHSRA